MMAQPPRITFIFPSSQSPTQQGIIYGNNFSTNQFSNTVYFGAVKTYVSANPSSTAIGITVPIGATYQPVTVLTPQGIAYASQSFDITFPNGGRLNPNSFGPKQDFETGIYPLGATIGDFNSDSHPDLAVINNGSNTVSVLLNSRAVGTTSFSSKNDFPVGNGPIKITTADMDGDGNLDIVVLSSVDNSISVLRNTGLSPISFSKVSYSVSSVPNSVCQFTIGDFDVDGRTDIAITNSVSNVVSVLRNTTTNGVISFAPQIDFPTGHSPHGITFNDLDNDGKPEIILTNSLDNTISVFRNTGVKDTISFAPRIDFATGANPQDVCMGGFIAVVNSSDNSVSIFSNTSTTGSISLTPKQDFPIGNSPSTLAVGDLDGDGKLDLIVTNKNSNDISLIRNLSSTNTYAFDQPFNLAVGMKTNGIAIGDLDFDFRPELIVAEGTGQDTTIGIFENLGISGSIPSINSFLPTTAQQNDTVTIKGINFIGTSSVKFGGIAAKSFIVVSDSVVKAVVNTGASGNIDVTTSYGSATLAGFIFYNPLAPVINSFIPSTATKGASVLIRGKNFTGASAVSFGVVAASSFTVNTDTTITAVVGNGQTGNVKVTTVNGTASLAGFTYVWPIISSFTPSSGSLSSLISIRGENLSSVTAVNFGNVPAASFNIVSDSQIVAVLGVGASGAVSVIGPGGNSSLAGFTFNYPQPVISSFNPQSGYEGTVIHITGTNFSSITSVSFGGVAADSFKIISDTLINAVVGNGASGSIKIANPAFSASQTGFVYLSHQPQIYSFTPAKGTTGTNVSVKGINFTGATAVSFGGTAASSFNIVSDTSIIAVVGSGTSGAVSITTSYGTATENGFTFINPLAPEIYSINPDSAAAGSNITIHGKNFTTASQVIFITAQATSFTVINDSTIVAVVPPEIPDYGRITVVTANGNAYSPQWFYFISPPEINYFTPLSGQVGTTVYIYGRYFAGVSQVSFGSVPATSFHLSSDTIIIAVVGSGATGNISVTTPNGTVSKGTFTYTVPQTPAPIIYSFSPGSALTGTDVIIAGKNFTGTTAVSFGGVPASSFIVSSDSMIHAFVGSGATGNITVTTPSGTATASGFNFIPSIQPPIIDHFSPTSGHQYDDIEIFGKHFTNAIAVSFGGVPAKSFTVFGDSLIIATVGAGASGNVWVETIRGGMDSLGGFTFVTTQNVLPFALLQFNATLADNQVNLQWQTQGERDISFYNIEHGNDTLSFTRIGSMSAKKDSINNYKYTDMQPQHGINYYRLKIVDTFKNSSYSYIISVVLPDSTKPMNAYPNPPNSGYVIVEHAAVNSSTQITIIDIMGRVVKTISVRPNEANTRIDISGLKKGVYKVVFINGSNITAGSILIE